MQVTTTSLDEFNKAAAEFARGLIAHSHGATVVALSGDLGAGKTTFVQAVAREFGVEESVTSPTFVIEKVYDLNVGHPMSYIGFKRLIHIDAYRLKGAHDLVILDWKELIADPGNLLLIEWPERVEGAVPDDATRISIEHVDENMRGLTIT